MYKICHIVIALLLLFTSCKKDIVTKNISVNGTVFNLCTDKGIGGVKVYFTIRHNKRIGSDEFSKMETVSNSDGSFSFNGIDVHSSDRYRYELATEEESGIGGGGGLNGDDVILENDKIQNYHTLTVVPTFIQLCFQISPSVHIVYPDTVTISYEQRTFHKNVPDLPYKSMSEPTGLQDGHPDCHLGNYPMGWWNITIDKTKGGVQTVTQDSIYIDWKGTATYTFSF